MGTGVSRLRRKKDDQPLSLRDIKHPPKLRMPYGVTCWQNVPFLPENFLERDAWEALLLDSENYGVTKQQLQELFLRLCSPFDVSLGTVQTKKFFREFDPRFRRVLRRLVLQRADGHPRMLFEDIVRFIFEFCGMDFYNLVTKSVNALRDFEIMNTVTVRAVVRYMNGDRDMDEFTRNVLAHLHADPPFHNIGAFVQLCVRYPSLVYPVILMQRSMQRRFFGLRFWREHHKRAGTQLLPPDFSKTDAAMITARVLMLECVSLNATPFQFGTAKTVTAPPAELLNKEKRRGRGWRVVDEVDDDVAHRVAAELDEIEQAEMIRVAEENARIAAEEGYVIADSAAAAGVTGGRRRGSVASMADAMDASSGAMVLHTHPGSRVRIMDGPSAGRPNRVIKDGEIDLSSIARRGSISIAGPNSARNDSSGFFRSINAGLGRQAVNPYSIGAGTTSGMDRRGSFVPGSNSARRRSWATAMAIQDGVAEWRMSGVQANGVRRASSLGVGRRGSMTGGAASGAAAAPNSTHSGGGGSTGRRMSVAQQLLIEGAVSAPAPPVVDSSRSRGSGDGSSRRGHGHGHDSYGISLASTASEDDGDRGGAAGSGSSTSRSQRGRAGGGAGSTGPGSARRSSMSEPSGATGAQGVHTSGGRRSSMSTSSEPAVTFAAAAGNLAVDASDETSLAIVPLTKGARRRSSMAALHALGSGADGAGGNDDVADGGMARKREARRSSIAGKLSQGHIGKDSKEEGYVSAAERAREAERESAVAAEVVRLARLAESDWGMRHTEEQVYGALEQQRRAAMKRESMVRSRALVGGYGISIEARDEAAAADEAAVAAAESARAAAAAAAAAAGSGGEGANGADAGAGGRRGSTITGGGNNSGNAAKGKATILDTLHSSTTSHVAKGLKAVDAEQLALASHQFEQLMAQIRRDSAVGYGAGGAAVGRRGSVSVGAMPSAMGRRSSTSMPPGGAAGGGASSFGVPPAALEASQPPPASSLAAGASAAFEGPAAYSRRGSITMMGRRGSGMTLAFTPSITAAAAVTAGAGPSSVGGGTIALPSGSVFSSSSALAAATTHDAVSKPIFGGLGLGPTGIVATSGRRASAAGAFGSGSSGSKLAGGSNSLHHQQHHHLLLHSVAVGGAGGTGGEVVHHSLIAGARRASIGGGGRGGLAKRRSSISGTQQQRLLLQDSASAAAMPSTAATGAAESQSHASVVTGSSGGSNSVAVIGKGAEVTPGQMVPSQTASASVPARAASGAPETTHTRRSGRLPASESKHAESDGKGDDDDDDADNDGDDIYDGKRDDEEGDARRVHRLTAPATAPSSSSASSSLASLAPPPPTSSTPATPAAAVAPASSVAASSSATAASGVSTALASRPNPATSATATIASSAPAASGRPPVNAPVHSQRVGYVTRLVAAGGSGGGAGGVNERPDTEWILDRIEAQQKSDEQAARTLTPVIGDSAEMNAVNVAATAAAAAVAIDKDAQALVLAGLSGSVAAALAQPLENQGHTAIDTRTRLAAFGFSSLMGAGGAQNKVTGMAVSDKTLPIPIPPRVSEYLLTHPHPVGAVCKLTSLQIAKIVLAHANSGAGQLYGIVRVPCLLCHRIVQHVDDINPNDDDADFDDSDYSDDGDDGGGDDDRSDDEDEDSRDGGHSSGGEGSRIHFSDDDDDDDEEGEEGRGDASNSTRVGEQQGGTTAAAAGASAQTDSGVQQQLVAATGSTDNLNSNGISSSVSGDNSNNHQGNGRHSARRREGSVAHSASKTPRRPPSAAASNTAAFSAAFGSSKPAPGAPAAAAQQLWRLEAELDASLPGDERAEGRRVAVPAPTPMRRARLAPKLGARARRKHTDDSAATALTGAAADAVVSIGVGFAPKVAWSSSASSASSDEVDGDNEDDDHEQERKSADDDDEGGRDDAASASESERSSSAGGGDGDSDGSGTERGEHSGSGADGHGRGRRSGSGSGSGSADGGAGAATSGAGDGGAEGKEGSDSDDGDDGGVVADGHNSDASRNADGSNSGSGSASGSIALFDSRFRGRDFQAPAQNGDPKTDTAASTANDPAVGGPGGASRIGTGTGTAMGSRSTTTDSATRGGLHHPHAVKLYVGRRKRRGATAKDTLGAAAAAAASAGQPGCNPGGGAGGGTGTATATVTDAAGTGGVFLVRERLRAGFRKPRPGQRAARGTIAHERMRLIRAREAEINRRVKEVKEQITSGSAALAVTAATMTGGRAAAGPGAASVGGTTRTDHHDAGHHDHEDGAGPATGISNNAVEEEEEEDSYEDEDEPAVRDEIEDAAVHAVTQEKVNDPASVALVTGTKWGVTAGQTIAEAAQKQKQTEEDAAALAAGHGGRRHKSKKTKTDKQRRHHRRHHRHRHRHRGSVDEELAATDTSATADSNQRYNVDGSVVTTRELHGSVRNDHRHGGTSSIAASSKRSLHSSHRSDNHNHQHHRKKQQKQPKSSTFAKSTARNTGFCGDCDIYCSRLAGHLFGYKVAARMLSAATVVPSVEDELARHSAKARAEGHPLMQQRSNAAEEEAAAALALAQQQQAMAGGGGEDDEGGGKRAAAPLVLPSPVKVIQREAYAYPDDVFIQLFDEETKRFFYYNVTVGTSQWEPPPPYANMTPYLDREARAEEDEIAAAARRELSKLRELASKAAKGKVQTALGQR